MQENRRRIRALILFVLVIIVSLLLIRFIVEFSTRDQNSALSKAFLGITGFLSAPFYSITIGSIEVSTVVGIVFVLALGYLISKTITGLERESSEEKMLEIVEVALRAFELLLIFRIILKFIGAEQTSPFVFLVYLLTEWTQGIILPLIFSFGTLEISSLIVLVLIFLLDLNTEVIVRIIKFISRGREKPIEPPPPSPSSEPPQPPESTPQPDTTAPPETPKPAQTIVINVPLVQADQQVTPQQPTVDVKAGDQTQSPPPAEG